MKKRLCFLVLFTSLLLSSLDAQMEYSVTAGINGVNFNEDGKSFLNPPLIGLFGSFAVDYHISERLELNTELHLQYLSFRYKAGVLFEEITEDAFFNLASSTLYPASAISEICSKMNSKITLGVGLNVNIILSQKHQLFAQALKIPPDNKFTPLTFGLNGKVKLDIKSFYLQVRYLFGLTNAGNFYLYDNGERSKTTMKSRVLQFGIGYTFNSKSKSNRKKRR